jgi:hypothetical protein
MEEGKHNGQHLHIIVNERRFDTADGVRPEMTGGQIAALVDVPAEDAVVRLESGGEPREIRVEETLHIKDGMRFVVTKRNLHIFVNRRKFDAADGVRSEMTGAQIAALVDVPADNAVVRLEKGGEPREIPVAETIHIKDGMHFLVTRKVVEGGYEPGAY